MMDPQAAAMLAALTGGAQTSSSWAQPSSTAGLWSGTPPAGPSPYAHLTGSAPAPAPTAPAGFGAVTSAPDAGPVMPLTSPLAAPVSPLVPSAPDAPPSFAFAPTDPGALPGSLGTGVPTSPGAQPGAQLLGQGQVNSMPDMYRALFGNTGGAPPAAGYY